MPTTIFQTVTFKFTLSFSGGTVASLKHTNNLAIKISLSGSTRLGYLIKNNLAFSVFLQGRTWKFHYGNPQIWLARPQTTDFTVYAKGKKGPLGAVQTLLETDGNVYQCKKLGDKMIYYGQYSIMSGKYLIQEAPVMARRTINREGILAKGAVCVDKEEEPTAHYFIDNKYMLFILTSDGLKVRDYSNQFSLLSGDTTCLFYDPSMNMVRIADGSYGFTYSVQDDALGWGPPNITGCAMKGGQLLIVAPTPITIPPFNIVTDWFDLGRRADKDVIVVGFSFDCTEDLYAALDYRWHTKGPVYTTPWTKADFQGEAHFYCSGVEFRLKAMIKNCAYLRLDDAPVTVKFANLKAANE